MARTKTNRTPTTPLYPPRSRHLNPGHLRYLGTADTRDSRDLVTPYIVGNTRVPSSLLNTNEDSSPKWSRVLVELILLLISSFNYSNPGIVVEEVKKNLLVYSSGSCGGVVVVVMVVMMVVVMVVVMVVLMVVERW